MRLPVFGRPDGGFISPFVARPFHTPDAVAG
jgi:hypothetical protein